MTAWGVVVEGADQVIDGAVGLTVFVGVVRVASICWLLGTPAHSCKIDRGCRA
jgi:hypothetical protein